jgi:hypothetical protein
MTNMSAANPVLRQEPPLKDYTEQVRKNVAITWYRTKLPPGAIKELHAKSLHEMIRHDLPPTPHGLIGVWKQIDAILRRQAVEPDYQYEAPLPRKP